MGAGDYLGDTIAERVSRYKGETILPCGFPVMCDRTCANPEHIGYEIISDNIPFESLMDLEAKRDHLQTAIEDLAKFVRKQFPEVSECLGCSYSKIERHWLKLGVKFRTSLDDK